MEKQPALDEKVRGGCMQCPGSHTLLEMDTVLYQGFGGYHVEKDGEEYYFPNSDLEWEEYKTLSQIEEEAVLEPDADWRVILNNPLRGGTWQRHGVDEWVLIESNIGFA